MKANLSVIVTNYNKPKDQIDECLNSIRDQTVAPREIILVDDGSTNPVSHKLATTIVLPHNVGVAKARAEGAKMASSGLLLFVDADDKLSPDYIQQCGRLIANHDIVYSNFVLFGEVDRNKLIEPPEKLNPKDFLTKCEIRVTSMMHRKVYDTLGGFREMSLFEDWDFWLRALCNDYTFAKANTFFWYRQNSNSRNRVGSDVKNEAIEKLTAPYEFKNGKIRERSSDDQKKK